MSNISLKRDYVIFFILYSISFSLLLLNFDGLYWDDWVLYNQSLETKKIFFSQFKNYLMYHFHVVFTGLDNSIFLYHLFIFISYFITGIFINLILKNIKELSSKDIFYITLLYLIMPVINSRIAISIIPFFFPVLIFYASFYLLTKYMKNNSYLLRVIILIGFYISFYTNSILVFYGIVLVYIYYTIYNINISIKNIKKFIIKYYDFILLPIVFFLIKIIYFKPYGIYSGYNSVGDISIFKLIFKLFKSIDTTIFDVLHQAFYISLQFWLLLIVIIYLYKKFKFKDLNFNINKNSKYLFLLGVLIFLLAVFPYIAVSKLPKVDSFSSRFQLLTPVGLAFIFYFGINLIVKYFKLNIFIRQSLIIIIIFSFVSKNISDYYKWQIDNLYMTSIMMNFKDNEDIKNNTTFIVNNNLRSELIYKRTPPYYEWNGMLKNIFNEDSRLMIKYKQYKNISKIKEMQQYKQYNFSSWIEHKPILVTISFNPKYKNKVSSRIIFTLLKEKIINYEQYLIDVKKLTSITTQKFMD